ncbi:MAG: hypothetical protein KZQ65_11615 [Candidatus Thiodiazotropha sp. (ex Gloverina cf. vestifex)]|nr:hypothetical protein [Candidatus Thiodiazotropha sp. (ex Gloverina cf. vestifex)]
MGGLPLEDNNIWYSVTNETTVGIPNPPPDYLFDFLDPEINKITPKGRSFSVSKDLRKTVYERLMAQNISYHTVIYGNSEFIVWDKKDSDIIDSIINDTAREALDAKLNR